MWCWLGPWMFRLPKYVLPILFSALKQLCRPKLTVRVAIPQNNAVTGSPVQLKFSIIIITTPIVQIDTPELSQSIIAMWAQSSRDFFQNRRVFRENF